MDEKTALITGRILLGGAFGKADQSRSTRSSSPEGESVGGVKRSIIRQIFGTSRENLYRKYPVLHKAPWLLPFCHIYRAVSGLVRKPEVVRLCFRRLRFVSDEAPAASRRINSHTAAISLPTADTHRFTQIYRKMNKTTAH